MAVAITELSGQHMEATPAPTFGVWLKSLRSLAGISQTALAEGADIHHTYVSDMETGKKIPSRKVIERIVKVLTRRIDPAEAERYLSEGLLAAGYASTRPSSLDALPEGLQIIFDAYTNGEADDQGTLENIARMIRKTQQEGVIGKRAE